jgi:hypothetical protein
MKMPLDLCSPIDSFAAWFIYNPSEDLMGVVGYVASALMEPQLSLHAASALRSMCDHNRKALAPQINAFGEVYNGLAAIAVSVQYKHIW